MDFAESAEQRMLREAVAKIASGFGHGYYAEKARGGGKPTELWDALAGAGYLGVNLPEEYGGGGCGVTELAIVCEEMAAVGCSLFLVVVSPGICGSILARHGTEEQKRRWLPGIADGSFKMAFAITEPDAGSNSHNLSTTADREGDGYRLRGQKYFISGVDEADAILGLARYALDKAAGYASQRKVWGAPIGTHQGLAHPLAQAKIDLELAKLMTYKAAWLFDTGQDAGEAANMAKFAAAETALFALDQAIQTHGGNGLASEFGLADLWFVARLLRTAPVSAGTRRGPWPGDRAGTRRRRRRRAARGSRS